MEEHEQRNGLYIWQDGLQTSVQANASRIAAAGSMPFGAENAGSNSRRLGAVSGADGDINGVTVSVGAKCAAVAGSRVSGVAGAGMGGPKTICPSPRAPATGPRRYGTDPFPDTGAKRTGAAGALTVVPGDGARCGLRVDTCPQRMGL